MADDGVLIRQLQGALKGGRLLVGAIDGAAAVVDAGTADWTASHVGTGQYRITFSPPGVAGVPLSLVVPFAAGARSAQIVARSGTNFDVQVRETTAGALVDFPVIFFAWIR